MTNIDIINLDIAPIEKISLHQSFPASISVRYIKYELKAQKDNTQQPSVYDIARIHRIVYESTKRIMSSGIGVWCAGAGGIWCGLIAIASLLAAIMAPNWALTREPIILPDPFAFPLGPGWGNNIGYRINELKHKSYEVQPSDNSSPETSTTAIHKRIIREMFHNDIATELSEKNRFKNIVKRKISSETKSSDNKTYHFRKLFKNNGKSADQNFTLRSKNREETSFNILSQRSNYSNNNIADKKEKDSIHNSISQADNIPSVSYLRASTMTPQFPDSKNNKRQKEENTNIGYYNPYFSSNNIPELYSTSNRHDSAAAGNLLAMPGTSDTSSQQEGHYAGYLTQPPDHHSYHETGWHDYNVS